MLIIEQNNKKSLNLVSVQIFHGVFYVSSYKLIKVIFTRPNLANNA